VRFDKSRSLEVERCLLGMVAAIDLDDDACAVTCESTM
jgi:hypothetical protein